MANSDITVIKRGTEDWYLYLAVLKNTNYLEQEIGINNEDYDEFLIAHILEYLTFKESVALLNYIYFHTSLNELEMKIKEYYDSYLLQNKGITGIIIPQ